MKTSFTLSILILSAVIASESAAQSFGVKGGVNFSNMLWEESELFIPYNTNVPDPKMKTGFHIGGIAEFPIKNLIIVETGLYFSTLGTNLTTEEPFGETMLITKEKQTPYYLQIPLLIKYPFTIKGLDFFGAAGGYGGYGIAGSKNTVTTFGDLEETEKESIAWGTEEMVDDFTRLDYGLKFGVGMVWKGIQFGVTYDWGLANISPDKDLGTIKSNRVLSISVGYILKDLSKGATASTTSVPKEPETEKVKKESTPKGKKAAALEVERLRKEQVAADSIAAVRAEEQRIAAEKAKADSLAAVRAAEEKAKAAREKAVADSIAAAQKAASAVIYRVQFASSTTKKGSYKVTIGGKSYNTWEYSYSGAFRSCVGEFKTFAEAMQFQKQVRTSGFPQAFVVAFKNNVRSTDPALFK